MAERKNQNQRCLNERLKDYIQSEENPFPRPIGLYLGISKEENMQVLNYLDDQGLRPIPIPTTPYRIPTVEIQELLPLNNYSGFYGLKAIRRAVARLKDPAQKLDYEIKLEKGEISTCWMCG